MKILIVEDEPPIAANIEEYAIEHFGIKLEKIDVVYTLEDAFKFLDNEKIDLCLLDLNLSGQDGFEIMERFVLRNFQTIVISAYTEKAITAFQYGILDFVPKPIDSNRIKLAFDRFLGLKKKEDVDTKYIAVRKRNEIFLVPVNEIIYFKADRYLVEVHQNNGSVDLIEKSLNCLQQILPDRFIRVHRSFIVDSKNIVSVKNRKGSLTDLQLKNGEKIPLSYKRKKGLKKFLLD